jgi:DNA-directed RNA polymerase specialized sigma24 family protein
MKKERDPTPEEFEKFLLWLDPDRDAAGRRLNLIQTRMIQILVSRGCIDAESLADEVCNRVAVRIDSCVTKYSDPLRCCLGFLENVYLEWVRDERKKINAREPPKARPADELEREDQCLQGCIGDLEKSDKDLFERYFEGEGRARIVARQKLAEELNLTPNALRIQAHRIRKKMRKCMEECIKRAETK